jgi:hypothetical protein
VGLGAAGDHHVRVVGAKVFAVGQTALQHRPARRVQRHRLGTLPEPDRASGGVDLVDPQQPDLAAGGSVQQRQDPEQGLVGVDVGVGHPAAKQPALRLQVDGRTREAAGLLGRQPTGGVGQHQPLASGEAEELPQHGQPPLAAVGQGGQERLDVTHVDQRPVQLAARLG